MANNKELPFESTGRLEENKRFTRLLLIISLISNAPRRWTRRRLAERTEVSERQIDSDLQVLRHGLKYELEHTRDGYYFTRAPELRAIHYTAAEALALLGALQLAQGTGALDAASLGAALARTEEALPGPFMDLVRSLTQTVGIQSAKQQRRAELLRKVQTARAELRCLAVIYESASSGGVHTERILRPYLLELLDGSWMLAAHDSVHNVVRDFRLDRLQRAELLDEHYTIPDDFDPVAYRGSGWGVLRGMAGEPEDVKLRFNAEEGRRVRDIDHHDGQHEVRQSDGTWLVTFRAGVTSETVRWVFKWGTGCTVLAPASLRAAVAEQARRIAALHDESSSTDLSV